MNAVNSIFPRVRKYFKTIFRFDLVAGLTVGMVVFPSAMAYAAIAGVNPIYGLYTAILPTIIGALFGSSNYLVTGPTNPTALVTISVLAMFVTRPDYLEFVFVLAILSGLVKLLLGVLRLGSIVRYVSNSVLIGFLSAAAVLIVIGQVGNLLGLPSTGASGAIAVILGHLQGIRNINLYTSLISLLTILVLVVLKQVNRKIPAALIAMLVSGLVVHIGGWNNLGVRLIGDLGLPNEIGLDFHIPDIDLAELPNLLLPAGAVALFGLVEAISVTKSLGMSSGQKVDASKEMIGQGLASILGGMFQCIPSSGSPIRSTLNYLSGARTRFSAAISGVFVFIILLLFSKWLAYIPLASLSAVVVVSAFSLVNRHQIEVTWQSRAVSRVVLLVTFIATLLFPLHIAIYLGALLSIGIFLYESSHMNLSYLTVNQEGNIIEHSFMDILNEKPDIAVVNMEGDMYFGAVDEMESHLERIMDSGVKVVILRFRRTHLIASTGTVALEGLIKYARIKGVEIILCGVREEVRQTLETSGIYTLIGGDKVFRANDILFESMQSAMGKAREVIAQRENFVS